MSRVKGSKNKPKGEGDVQFPLPLPLEVKSTHMSKLKHISKHLSNPSPGGLRPTSGNSTLETLIKIAKKSVPDEPALQITGVAIARAEKVKKVRKLVQGSNGPTTRPVKRGGKGKNKSMIITESGPINEHFSHYLPVFTSNLLISWDENNLKFICTNVENSDISGTGKSEMGALGEFILNRARIMKGG